MKTITFTNPHRLKHFEFFRGMNHPHFNLAANVDITALLPYVKNKGLAVTPTIVYLVARAANDIKEFRWRIRDHQIVEHDTVRPSFTVPTEEADVFSFCTVDYNLHAPTFIQNALAKIKEMQNAPSFEDDDKMDDYLFLSAMPWVSFTGIQHAMHYHPSDSVPRITWGKFFERDGKIWMPLSVQAHHAVIDGRHLGIYFQKIEDMAALPDKYLN